MSLSHPVNDTDATRYMLTDGLWVVMEPRVATAKRHLGGQRPVLPDRLFFEALLHLGRTGIPLRDLPGEFGDWRAVYQRLRRWVYSGAMRRLFEALTADPDFQEIRRVRVDSKTVRAHRRAAEEKRIGAARSAANEGLGRSRGGLTTEVVVTAAEETTPIVIDVVAGSGHDAPLLRPMLAKTVDRVGAIDAVVGDEGFDGEPQRQVCRRLDAAPVIPAKSDRVNPEPLDEPADRERNRIERLFAKAKEFRRIATRYDKRKRMFLGWRHLAFGFICLRGKTNVNRA